MQKDSKISKGSLVLVDSQKKKLLNLGCSTAVLDLLDIFNAWQVREEKTGCKLLGKSGSTVLHLKKKRSCGPGFEASMGKEKEEQFLRGPLTHCKDFLHRLYRREVTSIRKDHLS